MTTICAKISHEDSLVHFAILNCGGGDGVVVAAVVAMVVAAAVAVAVVVVVVVVVVSVQGIYSYYLKQTLFLPYVMLQ